MKLAPQVLGYMVLVGLAMTGLIYFFGWLFGDGGESEDW
jgi:hypothetical protein